VKLLAKVRVYELAKELNTNSKRLMEKLSEIDIMVKNHMSQLEESQIESLYKHIGVRGEEEKKEEEEKKPQILVSSLEKKIKTGPRIIRKTQINLDEKEPKNIVVGNDPKKGSRVTVLSETAGLMPGLTRPKAPAGKHSPQSTSIIFEGKTGIEEGIIAGGGSPDQKTINENNYLKKDQNSSSVSDAKETVKNSANHTDQRVGFNQTKQGHLNQGLHKSPPTNNPNRTSVDSRPRENSNDGGNKAPYNRGGQYTPRTAANQSGRNPREDSKAPYNPNQKNRPFQNDRNQRPNPQGGQEVKSRETQQNGRRPYPSSGSNDRPKTGLNIKEELIPTAQKPESKRDYHGKVAGREVQKEVRKDVKKDFVKPVAQKPDKKINKNALMGEKKGVSEVLSEDFILKEFYSDDNSRKKGPRNKFRAKEQQVVQRPVVTLIKVSGDVTVKDLAEALKKTATEVIKKLMALGIMATVNQEIDLDTSTLVAEEFGVKVEKEVVVSEEDILFDDTEDIDEKLQIRPPVVVVMGHVDHGKTSLLDTLRKSNVMDKEAGGITQHIGAYMVTLNGRKITFLDTPGHEAFTAMRARGAKVTDIAILVVAADDGVMPQTIEAINHAKAAGISIIVAINKIDKPGSNPERVKQELTEHGLLVEEWGGDVISVPVSAKEGTNIEQLLEMVLLSADMLELRANPDRQAKGTVIEAKLDKDRGPVATVLVQRGTLKLGDSVVSGTSVGRIRAMVDDKGNNIKNAGPSMPVEVLGLPEVLEAGEIFYAIDDEKVAKQLAEKRRVKIREQSIKSTTKITLDDLFSQIKEGKVKELNLIVKADVQGSVEAVRQSLQKLTNEEVRVNIIHGGVGTITESDVTFADVSNAIIIGFNVRPSSNVTEMAKEAGVDLRLYRVIYKAIEDIEAAMKGMLDPTYQEVVLGHIQVRQTFKASGIGVIGGGYVIDGKAGRNNDIRVVRDGVVVHEGKLGSLKRFKDDAKEVAQGYECGFTIERFHDIKEEDIIECFHMEEVKR
jgi:translation initiation factor IF-2